jgi:Conserved TM helix
MGTLRDIFITPSQMIFAQVSQFVAILFLGIFVFLVGWLISRFIIKPGVTIGLKKLKFDELSKRIELADILEKGGIQYTFSELAGVICYWLALLITVMVALNAAGLVIAADLLQKIVLFVPNIIAAVFILLAGMFLSVVLKNIVKASASNAGIYQANLLSRITEIVVIVFTVAMALEQLHIGAKLIELTIGIVLGSLGLGFAIAIGLGCKDLVAKIVWEVFESARNKK